MIMTPIDFPNEWLTVLKILYPEEVDVILTEQKEQAEKNAMENLESATSEAMVKAGDQQESAMHQSPSEDPNVIKQTG